MLVAGVDENGLGPGLGPLVVTAVLMELSVERESRLRLDRHRLPAGVGDSKQVFRRTPASYADGESAALAMLASAGHAAPDLVATLDRVTRAADLRGGCDAGLGLHVAATELPLWGGDPSPVTKSLTKARIRIVDIACRVLLPAGFNSVRTRPGGKLALDYQLFEEALALLSPRPELALLGKIGGTRFYGPWLGASRRLFGVDPLAEKPAESRYRMLFDGEPLEMRFVRDGDATYLPIAAASVIGKYLREAMMLCLNRALGFDAAIPHASGYWSDPKTREAIDRFDERLATSIPRSSFLRNG